MATGVLVGSVELVEVKSFVAMLRALIYLANYFYSSSVGSILAASCHMYVVSPHRYSNGFLRTRMLGSSPLFITLKGALI